jgi:hypothetical protein
MAFDGQLLTNEVFASLYNQIISLQVFPSGIGTLNGIYGTRKVDGTLYGDTKLYISTDVLQSYEWDGTDTPGSYNLLTIKRPPAPVEQAIVMDTFRQIPLTVDEYLTKRAFMDEGSFGSFNGVILSWLQKTKEVYEHTTYTTRILVSTLANSTLLGTIALGAPTTTLIDLDKKIYKAQELYRNIEDHMKEIEEPSRDYNDNSFLRNYKMSDFDIIVPLGILSGVTKFDVPFLYGPDEKAKIKEVHWKYFGTIIAGASTTPSTNTVVRALVEKVYDGDNYFPGDLLPDSQAYLANETYTATYTAKPDLDDVFPVYAIHKQDFPIMSAFSVGTSFFNARRLDMNHYLTFGHNDPYDAHIGEHALLKFTITNTDAT